MSTLSVDNIKLYQSLGYVEYKREQVNEMLTFVYLEKNDIQIFGIKQI